MNLFYSQEEAELLGFKSVGNPVYISKDANFYGISQIEIGNNVRIDDFVLISAGKGGVSIGNYVHIGAYSLLKGQGKIILSDFSGISSHVSIYSSSDDYSGEYLTNPTVSDSFTNVFSGDVILKKHVIIGSGSVILPNVILEEGVAIGALSLVNRNCERFHIYHGNPIKKITQRDEKLLLLEHNLLNNQPEL